jgi:hypothetical protein
MERRNYIWRFSLSPAAVFSYTINGARQNLFEKRRVQGWNMACVVYALVPHVENALLPVADPDCPCFRRSETRR